MWYRSWPETVPEGRAYVQDGLPRLLMRDCNYSTLPSFQPWPDDQPGFFMLEWDVALDGRQRDMFVEHAMERPERILVAPYWKQYIIKARRPPEWRQLHRSELNRPIKDGTPRADLFGFGCIYMPQAVLNDWLASNWPGSAGGFTDSTFSHWHLATHGQVHVDWSVHPQHLHSD